MATNRRDVLTVALVLVMTPGIAAAVQGQAAALPPTQSGTEVRIVTTDGQELKGTVGAASNVRLVLQVGDEVRTLGVRQLQLVETVDDLKNGVLLGALLGGGLTVRVTPWAHPRGAGLAGVITWR